MTTTKLVCVMRRDLRNTSGMKPPKGKLIAQGGHAYTAAVLRILTENPRAMEEETILKEWLDNSFVKICLGVDSQEELLDIYEKANLAGLNTVLITDKGDTQFGGVPTITCIAIGPDKREKIDELTGRLRSF